MKTKPTPAQYVIKKFGGGVLREAARQLGINSKTVWRWTQPRPKGTGGALGNAAQQRVIARAKVLGIAIDRAKLVL